MHAAETEVITSGGFFAFAARADHIAGAILVGTKERTAFVDAFLFPGLGGIEGCGRALRIAGDPTGLGELVKDLASQTSTLVRQEIKLAQAEVTEKGKVAGRGAGMLAGAAIAALLALGALTACLIAAAGRTPLMVASLIGGAVAFGCVAIPMPVLRPSSATAMPVKPASTTCRLVVWIWNGPDPITSAAPARPANAPAIAIETTIERLTETPP